MLQQKVQQIQLPKLELLAKHTVEGFIIGLHKSPFHGFSVEFAEHKLYNPGDNLSHVDWKVYGRSDKMFTKKYEEETNLRCCIAIDVSSSMHFQNEEGVSKLQASVIASACLIEFLKKQMDASALALFDERINILTKAGTSNSHKKLLFHQLESAYNKKEETSQTNISGALHELAEQLKRRSLLILFSDLLHEDINELKDALQHLRYNKHEVILFYIGDKKTEWDFNLPNQPLELIDLETNETVRVQAENARAYYQKEIKSYIKEMKDFCLKNNIDFHKYDIGAHPEYVLRSYLIKRKKLR